MSTPRYRPRDFVLPEYQRRFGKSFNMRWLAADEVDSPDQLFAARMQNEAAVKIVEAIYASGRTVKSYAKDADVAYLRLAQVLRGETVMRLEDMATAHRILGLKFLG